MHFNTVVTNAMMTGHYEPTPSTREFSVREMMARKPPHRIYHRFPFRGGISAADIITCNIAAANPLFAHLRMKSAH